MECKKCAGSATTTLRKKDFYCNNCFIANTNHKFRACIGKNKILSKNEKVLVCLSGGLSSTVLLDLVCNGISLDSHKKLRITPMFLYLIGVEDDSLSKAKQVIKQCNGYNFNVHLVHISQYMKDNLDQLTTNIPLEDSVTEEQFISLLNTLPPTAYNDFLLKIQRSLFIECAEKLGCRFVFTGETTAKLAINLLSSLALGRGSQVEHDVGFCDTRNRTIKIIKPMKEISQEELHYYITIKKILCPFRHDHIKANSLQSVIGDFVTELQNTFPATISTVCKTADKIGNHNEPENKEKCIICESDLGKQNSNLTALEATMLSRTVSNRRPQKNEDLPADLESIKKDDNKTLFPYIHEKLCYGCSRNYLEADKHKMPHHVKELLNNK